MHSQRLHTDETEVYRRPLVVLLRSSSKRLAQGSLDTLLLRFLHLFRLPRLVPRRRHQSLQCPYVTTPLTKLSFFKTKYIDSDEIIRPVRFLLRPPDHLGRSHNRRRHRTRLHGVCDHIFPDAISATPPGADGHAGEGMSSN